MIITLENGIEIVLDDIVEDPKAKSTKWLREYMAKRESPGPDPGSSKTPTNIERSQCDDTTQRT